MEEFLRVLTKRIIDGDMTEEQLPINCKWESGEVVEIKEPVEPPILPPPEPTIEERLKATEDALLFLMLM